MVKCYKPVAVRLVELVAVAFFHVPFRPIFDRVLRVYAPISNQQLA